MTQTDVVIARLRVARKARGWSARRLAERCAELGVPSLDRSTITNIETGRRQRLGLDEFLTLTTALELAPTDLLAEQHQPRRVCATCGDAWPCAKALSEGARS